MLLNILPKFKVAPGCFAGKLYYSWLFLVTVVYIYNAVAVTLRAAFRDAPFYDCIKLTPVE